MLKDCLPDTFVEMFGYKTLNITGVRDVARALGVSVRQTEIELLQMEIVPYRYIGTAKMIGASGLLRLRQSTVAIAGCGGVGGFACEICVRLGIGKVILIDGDKFEESNLNRQLYAEEENIGENKAVAAARRVRKINAGTEAECYEEFITAQNIETLLCGAQIVIDAVDCLNSRFMLQEYCQSKGIPFVFGGIGNSVVQVTAISPRSDFLSRLFDRNQENDVLIGNPAPTAALCGSLLAAEALKIICGDGEPLFDSILQFDWLYNSFQKI